jgi:hypothetical protein
LPVAGRNKDIDDTAMEVNGHTIDTITKFQNPADCYRKFNEFLKFLEMNLSFIFLFHFSKLLIKRYLLIS